MDVKLKVSVVCRCFYASIVCVVIQCIRVLLRASTKCRVMSRSDVKCLHKDQGVGVM